MSDLHKTMEAYLQMVSEKSCGKDRMKEEREECPKCEGEGCDHCDGKGYHEVEEAKKLDPVNDKENDKKFKDRKDKDIDNDGDVDDSDEYLHNRRAKVDNEIDGGEKPADNADDDKKKKDKNPRTSDKTAEISKIGEKVNTKEAFESMWSAMEEAVNQKKGATPPEGMDDKESKSGKDFKAMHKVDAKDHDDMEKVEEPKERKVKKEMKEYEVIRALLSGKPLED